MRCYIRNTYICAAKCSVFTHSKTYSFMITSYKILLEAVWWIVTIVIVVVVMYPIWTNYPAYRFNTINIVNIVAFVTFTRYTFFLQYTFLEKLQYAKIAFILFTMAIVATIMTQMQSFNVWVDGGDPDVLLESVKKADMRESLLNYIKSEYIFFIVGAIVAAVFLAGRLMISVWRLRNRGQA